MKFVFITLVLMLITSCTVPTKIPTSNSSKPSHTIIPEPTATPYQTYTSPIIQSQSTYILALVGDSMTDALGPLGGPFSEKLNQLYPDKEIVVDNYSAGSTNILSVKERLSEPFSNQEWQFPPLLQREDVDVVIVESFAYNPLSHIEDRATALARQTQTLEELMMTLERQLPQARILFLATIAPNKDQYGATSAKLTPEQSQQQAQERIAYLENHIQFANRHNIPVINVYKKSLNETGTGSLEYINPDDDIHPSAEGVDLLSQTMAEYIYTNEILPH